MALGVGTTTALAELIMKTYDPVFESLRDQEATLLGMIPKTTEDNDVPRWHIEANDQNPVWSISEAALTAFITSSNTATDGVGTGTLFLAPNVHQTVEAAGAIRHIVQDITLGGKVLAAVKGKPGAFKNALAEETRKSLGDWNKQINNMLIDFTSTTSGNSGLDFDGLMVLLRAAGTTYAGVNYSTYPEYKPYISVGAGSDADGTGGTSRALSLSLMDDVMDKLEGGIISTTQRHAHVDKIITGRVQYTNYKNLLAAQRRYTDSKLNFGFDSLEYDSRPLLSVPKFNGNKMWFYSTKTPQGSPAIEYRVLKNMDTKDHSQLIVDGIKLIMTHYANFLAKGRMQQGVLATLS